MITNDNLLLMTDVYKMYHMIGYKPGITKVYSYLCYRSDRKYKDALFFGLQPIIKRLEKKITSKDIREYCEYYKEVLGVNEVPKSILKKLNALKKLGYLPLEIKAIAEGTVLQNKNVLATVTNTHDDFPWVVGFFESYLLKVWAPCTVATYSKRFVETARKFAAQTSDSEFLVPFLIHDFGYRACMTENQAELMGAAHLINSCGTDTLPALKFIKNNYGFTATAADPILGCSVPATEHSLHCSFGPTEENELEYVLHQLKMNPTGLLSVVSDAYDYFRMLTVTLPKVKDQILAREGKYVVRPDSGNPIDILCGIHIPKYETIEDAKSYLEDVVRDIANAIHGEQNGHDFTRYAEVDNKVYEVKIEVEYNRYDKQYYYVEGVDCVSCTEIELTPAQKGTFRILDEMFGSTVNSKGFKELNGKIGVIYGDGMYYDRYVEILNRMVEMKYATTNLVIGTGGLLLQSHSRDDLGGAFKATFAVINDEKIDLFKDPITDPGKRSHKGLMQLVKEQQGDKTVYVTKDQVSEAEEQLGELQQVFYNGKITKTFTFNEVRENSRK